MKKIMPFTSAFLCCTALLLLLASCNSNDTPDVKKDPAVSAAPAVAPAAVQPAAALSGNLDTVWIDAATFNALGAGTRITFKFFDTLNSWTLRGWTGNANSWNNRPPDVRLSKGRQSPVLYGSGSYFGVLQLTPNQYNSIRQTLTSSHASYVVFGPVNPTTGTDAGQITYSVFVTSDNPGNFSPDFKYKYVVDPTGVTINPSPPKNSE